MPKCNCGFNGDAESVASLTGIEVNLLPFWLGRHPDHELAKEPIGRAAKLVRSYAEKGDSLALAIFDQQAKALGRLFTISANFTDPDAYFVGGGVVEAAPISASGSSAAGAAVHAAAGRAGREGSVRRRARPRHGGSQGLGHRRPRLSHARLTPRDLLLSHRADEARRERAKRVAEAVVVVASATLDDSVRLVPTVDPRELTRAPRSSGPCLYVRK